MITYHWQVSPVKVDFKPLYEQNGWARYLNDWAKTERAIRQATYLAALEGEQAVGLARGVSDGETILYLQDLLVLPARQHQGIGTALVKQMLGRFPSVGQVVLIAEPTRQAQSFYQQFGFQSVGAQYGNAMVLDRR
ncbi:GNAT family N-acetyltransferase [Lacticaseibacillus jixianensis]|uniref:GNAT family N-acetyltransferase n=1 Tax=Lacticaseibacillus jixianensis TaxID=2486012 RepID=A0ABW4BAB1_9LACO|nr:GNAT family N-acetyltransferase [Lacticaseibacillus jixianensis]